MLLSLAAWLHPLKTPRKALTRKLLPEIMNASCNVCFFQKLLSQSWAGKLRIEVYTTTPMSWVLCQGQATGGRVSVLERIRNNTTCKIVPLGPPIHAAHSPSLQIVQPTCHVKDKWTPVQATIPAIISPAVHLALAKSNDPDPYLTSSTVFDWRKWHCSQLKARINTHACTNIGIFQLICCYSLVSTSNLQLSVPIVASSFGFTSRCREEWNTATW